MKWNLAGHANTVGNHKISPVEDVLEIRIPLGFSVSDMGIVERFSKGRVLLSFPNEYLN